MCAYDLWNLELHIVMYISFAILPNSNHKYVLID